jgi:hypothetical protein
MMDESDLYSTCNWSLGSDLELTSSSSFYFVGHARLFLILVWHYYVGVNSVNTNIQDVMKSILVQLWRNAVMLWSIFAILVKLENIFLILWSILTMLWSFEVNYSFNALGCSCNVMKHSRDVISHFDNVMKPSHNVEYSRDDMKKFY